MSGTADSATPIEQCQEDKDEKYTTEQRATIDLDKMVVAVTRRLRNVVEAQDGDVFAVPAVVYAPLCVRTLAQVALRSATLDVVQPDRARPDAVVLRTLIAADVPEPETVADDSCCRVVETVVADGPPAAAVIDLETPLACVSASKQRHRAVSQTRHGSLFVGVGTVAEAPVALPCALGEAFLRSAALD